MEPNAGGTHHEVQNESLSNFTSMELAKIYANLLATTMAVVQCEA